MDAIAQYLAKPWLPFYPEGVPSTVPVPHLEITREVARRFDQLYCGVDPQTSDEDYVTKGGLFPVVQPKLGRVRRLVETGGPGPNGELLKMSKSFDNAIFLSDDADIVQRKVMAMYTDPKRLRASDPGTVENNPVWIFHEAFNPERAWVEEYENAYRQGKVGDVTVKRRLVEVLNTLLEPIRARRKYYQARPDSVIDALRAGTVRAIAVAEETLALAKKALRQDYFHRSLMLR
jgi:tryptophanyl-tRNA synthetase